MTEHVEPRHEEITGLLSAWNQGDRAARDELMDLVYPQLRKIAQNRLARHREELSVQATELVHEFYLRLLDQERVTWHNRVHFFAIAGRLLRRLILDQVRWREREKRGGGIVHLSLDTVTVRIDGADLDFVALDQALSRLEAIDERAVRVVEMLYLAGLSHDEAAAALGIGRATVTRSWRFARSWLRLQLAGADRGDP